MTKEPNELGLHDMTGNVWEWCWDRYGSYGGGSQADPRGASAGANRVLRGGCWGNFASGCRAADRVVNSPDNSGSSVGFRVVRSR